MTHARIIPQALGLLAALAVVLLVAGCGGGGEETSTSRVVTAVPDKEGDAEALNRILARQKGAIAAYERVIPDLTGDDRAIAERFRTQEQEHTNAVVKMLRRIGAAEDAEADEVAPSGPLRTRADELRFLYEVESATIDLELSAVAQLSGEGARRVIAATAANNAQHLVELRRLLGAEPPATVPEAFESGVAEAP